MPINEGTSQLLARYLDGALSGEALASFESLLLSDAALQMELETLRRIDAALQRRFTVPAMTSAQVLALADGLTTSALPSISASGPATSLARLRAGRLPLARLGIAAALVGGIFGLWMVWDEVKPDPTANLIQGPPPIKTAAAYYNTELARGFEPDWVCSNDQEFASTFRDRLGQALALGPSSDGTKMLGIDYAPILSPHTIGVLGNSKGKPVLVLIDRLTADNRDAMYYNCASLQVYRREVDALVLYEISPLPEAHMLDLFTKVN